MEEEKAAAYYDELSRKGEGAAKFKQGLGFSSQRSSDPFSSSKAASSLFSNFVRASSPGKEAEVDKKAALESIQNKLKKSRDRSPSPRSRGRDDRHSRGSRRRSSSRERGGRERHDRERRRRSRSDSGDESRSGRRRRSRRSRSPHGGGNRDRERSRRSPKRESSKSKNVGVDYSQLIEGYAQMAPAERVKAKMKLQLSQTAANDMSKGTGWERFDFNKDAPLDDDDEIEAAEGDASVVKGIGQSFRFAAVEDNEPKEAESEELRNPLLSEKVIAMQQGSWRDRARKKAS
ncbi:probable ATP-dependent RNA helicase DDX46 isoform X2 [Dioscorea cayenensis subsp. rotundata]|uniref:Probable ATP-dependent RNA helicase DDX46 isoform X2 n=1 Tax=Dioscorea cayennensis subsp. rotundata TaxID=55577 RepID=A0AB40AZY9_DIOCR|nr:probable ATP-dependent RNA helicase DDX46 isoform X2 [Dioscorea cayenensis subsp. rotundata]